MVRPVAKTINKTSHKPKAQQELHVSSLKQIVHGAAITFVLGMAGYLIAFLIRVQAARYFGPQQYGLYELINTILGILFLACALGIPNGASRYFIEYIVKKKDGLLRGYIQFVLYIPVVVGVICSVLLYIFASQITAFFVVDSSFTWLLQIISIIIPFSMATSTINMLLLLKKKSFASQFGHNFLEKVVVLCSVIAAWFYHLTIQTVVIGLALAYLASFIFSYFAYKKYIKIPEVKPIYVAKEWFAFSWPLLFASVFGFLLSWTDNLVIAKYLHETQLGVYGIAYSLTSYLSFIPSIFLTLFVPVLAELLLTKQKAFHTIFARVSVWAFCITYYLGLVLLFFPKQILSILFGAAYADGWSSVTILVFSFLAMSYFVFYNTVLLIKKDTQFLLWSSFAFAIFNLLLNIILVKQFQTITVVAFGSALSIIGIRISEYIRCKKHINEKVPWLYLLKIIVAGLCSIVIVKALFVFVFNHSTLPQIIKLIIAGITYTLLFGATIILSGLLTNDDKMIMHTIFTRIGISEKSMQYWWNALQKFIINKD